MTGMRIRTIVLGGMALAMVLGDVSAASAQPQQTPKGWSYELRDGRRVAKSNRVDNPDGSWREESRQGNCVTVKQKSATGEYKETRQCNPGQPG